MNATHLQIRPMRDDEVPDWGRMRSALWPDCSAEENAEDAANYLAGGNLRLVLFAVINDQAVGFAEISERNIADGCDGGPAAYLEGWYVDQNHRRKGAGKALVRAAATWAREKNYACFGSDVELDNTTSQMAHLALGFEETGRVVTYRMRVR